MPGGLSGARAALLSVLLLAAQGATAQEARFDVLEIRVEGNTVLPVKTIEKAVTPHLGTGRTVADVERARADLEQAYHDAGYLTVTVLIPEQQVVDAVVTLKVVESTISRLRVVGSRYYEHGRILEGLRSLAEGSVPNFAAAQEDLAQVNNVAERRVVPVLRAGRAPGTTEIDLNVEDRPPYGASLELNNYYSPNTGRLRLNASASYNNLFQRDHRLQVQFQTAPGHAGELKVWLLSYLIPLARPARYLSLYAVKSDSRVAALSDITVLGRGEVFGMRYVVPLETSEHVSDSFTFGADFKDFSEDTRLAGASATAAPIRYAPFSAGYNATRNDEGGSWRYGTSAVFALRGIGSSDAEFNNKRYKATGNFLVLKGDLARTQTLGALGSLNARLEGQLADQPLVSNEQFIAGGATSVRGYLQAETQGDRGVAGALELRGPSIAPAAWTQVNELRPSVFTDGAHLRRVDPLPSEPQRTTLASWGLGLSWRAYHRLSALLSLAWPLRETSNTPAHKPRLQFKLVWEL
jgi:hemolysin activation/secretion protein